MISYLNGKIAAKNIDHAIIDINGIGFKVNMSTFSLAALPSPDKIALVHVYMQVREDDIQLFGFVSESEKKLFERLISISGVGPKVALSALSCMSAEDLMEAITAQDVAAVSKVPGIGKKTAQRIILELKGVLTALENNEDLSGYATSDSLKVASEALLSMGFSSAEVKVALKGADKNANDSTILQYALKRLG